MRTHNKQTLLNTLELTSDMSLRSCLLVLRFLERERDDYGSVSEIKLDLPDDCVSLAVRTSVLCSMNFDKDRQGVDNANRV